MSSELWLYDDSGAARETLAVGETVFVAGRGLRPTTVYEFALAGEGGAYEVLARYVSDRHGALSAPLLPYIGRLGAGGARPQTIERACKAHREQTYSLRVAATGRGAARATRGLKFVVARPGREPRLFVCDARGRLLTGLVQSDDVDITNLQSVAFEFQAYATGEIEIDDIEFSA